MLKMIRLCFLILILNSCSTSSYFVREGYKIHQDQIAQTSKCRVYITYQHKFNPSDSKELGTIKAEEPGMGVDCQEDYVLRHLVSDACSLGANVINITKESRPNFWSTCYRAEADLLSVQKVRNIKTDPKYHPDQIAKRSELGHRKTKEALGAGMAGGIFGAIITN